jgi:hypothetical protein
MTYAKGSNILATDLNGFVGDLGVTNAYASSVAATSKVAALYGVGFGDRGYGQTTPNLTPVTSGSAIQASKWVDLRTAISNMATYQGTAQTLLPPATEFVAGSSIIAEASATTAYDFQTMINNIDANRLTASAGNLSLVTGSLTSTRASSWGTDATPSITAEFTMTFTSENETRYFFNSGGTLNLNLSHANTSSTQNSNWNTVLSSLGTVSMGARTTSRSGSGGTPANLGYYNLTTSAQVIFSGNIGTGAYTSNSVTVTAWVVSIGGVNGGNGNVIKMRVVLNDGHSNVFSDIVASGTVASMGYKRAASVLTGIAAPAFALTTGF